MDVYIIENKYKTRRNSRVLKHNKKKNYCRDKNGKN